MWLVFYSCKHSNVTFSCVYQREWDGDRPGRVSPSAVENSLFSLQLQREAEERRWKYTFKQFFSTLNHGYIILGVPILQIISQKDVKYGPLKVDVKNLRWWATALSLSLSLSHTHAEQKTGDNAQQVKNLPISDHSSRIKTECWFIVTLQYCHYQGKPNVKT